MVGGYLPARLRAGVIAGKASQVSPEGSLDREGYGWSPFSQRDLPPAASAQPPVSDTLIVQILFAGSVTRALATYRGDISTAVPTWEATRSLASDSKSASCGFAY